MKKVLFLDFDGVLFDTLLEVYVVNRYLTLGVDFLAPVNEKEYKKFSKFKYLVYNIWMFYYYNPILFSDTNENEIEQKFKTALLNRNIKKEEEFCLNFIKAREILVSNHKEFWQNLEKPYGFFFEIKKLYEEKNINLVIASKKNKAAIVQRFLSYGFKLNENLVFAREVLDNYSSKGEFIDEYMQKQGFESAIFVDDNFNNLKSTQNNKKVQNIFALWGNPQPNIEGDSEQSAIEKIKTYFM